MSEIGLKRVGLWPLDKGLAITRPLTPKQTRFVQEYLIDCNATQAAIRAGYSAKTAEQQGSRVLGYVEVAAAVAEGQAAIAEKFKVTEEWLVGEFKENHRLAREGNPVMDRYGKPTGGVMRQIAASNKAVESIAVITGFWVNKTKVGVDSDLATLMERIDGRSRGL
jgi:phage terminase small subunit